MSKKSRKKERKPRSTSLVLDMGKPVTLNSVAIGEDGSIIVESVLGKEQPIAAYVVTAYERNKGAKVINKLSLPSDNLTFVPNKSLIHYSRILTVDTNKPIKELPNVVFIGIIVAKVLPQSGGRLELQIYQESVAEFHNLNIPSERFGWSFACASAINCPSDGCVAVIVDSDLNSITSINRHDEAIIANYYLPNGFELLYASSDAGGGYIANDLIRRCDRNTREVAQKVVLTQTSSLPLLMKASPGEPFTHIRIWNRFVNSVS